MNLQIDFSFRLKFGQTKKINSTPNSRLLLSGLWRAWGTLCDERGAEYDAMPRRHSNIRIKCFSALLDLVSAGFWFRWVLVPLEQMKSCVSLCVVFFSLPQGFKLCLLLNRCVVFLIRHVKGQLSAPWHGDCIHRCVCVRVGLLCICGDACKRKLQCDANGSFFFSSSFLFSPSPVTSALSPSETTRWVSLGGPTPQTLS